MSLDERIYLWVGSMRGTSPLLDQFMLLFELNTLKYIVVGLFLCAWLTKNPRLQKGVFVAMLTIAAAILLRPIYKDLWFRDRPYVVFGCPGLAECYPDSAFPSGHAFLIFGVMTALWLYSRTAGQVMLVIAFFMCISRIYLGEHWPSDLVAGGALGSLTALGLTSLCNWQPVSAPLDTGLARVRSLQRFFRRPSTSETAVETVVPS